MRYSSSPATTSLPSVNTRSSTMPGTRARTSATRFALRRPGSSLTTLARSGATVIVDTIVGGMPLGACSPLQADRTSRASALAGTRRMRRVKGMGWFDP
ncbi:hypothetical protein [Alkalisalibacterium limincola]|uniref:hypothetical protein n=1 Tax=Alkalisalibacterium limincola TaxID=2699169 RepID=UPI002101DCC3|nr:hypothetical protein [Alkalisalibacterium limincola]